MSRDPAIEAAPDAWSISSRTSAELAYERIRRAIMDGEFAPGERLAETRIAERLGVSRTPVRESFTRLVKDGLLHPGERGGVIVVDPRSELNDIYYLREAIEGCAARLAALRATAQETTQIMALALSSQQADPSDLHGRARLNAAFHLAIAAAAHAPRLERLVEDYRALFVSPVILRSYSAERTEGAVAAHGRIADAIAAGDGDAAEAAMRQHLRLPGDRLQPRPDQVPSRAAQAAPASRRGARRA